MHAPSFPNPLQKVTFSQPCPKVYSDTFQFLEENGNTYYIGFKKVWNC